MFVAYISFVGQLMNLHLISLSVISLMFLVRCWWRREGRGDLPKGPKFVSSNAMRHSERTKTWHEKCADVDIDALRVKLSIDYVRLTGGLTYEDRQVLKARIAAIQIPKEQRARRLEARRERDAA